MPVQLCGTVLKKKQSKERIKRLTLQLKHRMILFVECGAEAAAVAPLRRMAHGGERLCRTSSDSCDGASSCKANTRPSGGKHRKDQLTERLRRSRRSRFFAVAIESGGATTSRLRSMPP